MKLSRRTALQLGGAAAGMSLLGLKPAMAEPKKGGHFRLALSDANTSASMDPATFVAQFDQIGLRSTVYNMLTEVTATGEIIPELAESFEASPDAKVWTFRLRQGVQFHNGKELVAEDVVASINHHRGEDSKSGAKAIVDPIVDVRAEDPYTVVFELESGNADFPFVVNDYHLVIMQAKDGKADWQSGIGTGGYVLKKWEAGVRVELERNPNYFKAGRAHFDQITVLGIADAAARQAALIAGEVDAINRVDLKTAHLLARNPGVVLEETSGTAHFAIPMHCNTAPFDDVNVRLALKYAIDRQAIVDTILLGHGTVGNDNPIAPANRYFNAELEQRVYDPDRAKFHLKEAGLDTLSVKLSASDAAYAGALDTAVLYREHAKAAGIDIEVVQEPADGYWSDVWLKKPFSMSTWGGRPTEDGMFSLAYAAGAPWNESFWDNARFNELLIAARAELDDAKRREMYGEMQALVRDDGGTIIPAYQNFVDARSAKLAREDVIAGNWEMDGFMAVERWWFA